MSADGNWIVTINTPMGARTMAVAIATSGDTFAGKVNSEMGVQDVTGKIDGDTLTWRTDITSPMPMTLDFTAKVDGDRMTGQCRLGVFGRASLTGERA
jgi:hypothetical protein